MSCCFAFWWFTGTCDSDLCLPPANQLQVTNLGLAPVQISRSYGHKRTHHSALSEVLLWLWDRQRHLDPETRASHDLLPNESDCGPELKEVLEAPVAHAHYARRRRGEA